jgi:hypothetical protein
MATAAWKFARVFFSLSPREERAGREPERGVFQIEPFLPRPFLHFVEERKPEGSS